MGVIAGDSVRTMAIVLLISAGCGAAAPSPSPTPTPSAASSPSPEPTQAASPAPSPTVALTPRPTAKPVLTDLAVETHRVPDELARHVTAFVSLGDQVVWSGGPSDDGNDLYSYAPGANEPVLLYANPDRHSLVTSIAGSGAGYVFTDERWIDGEPHGWRLLYLPAPGAQPLVLDSSTDDKLIAPTIAMDDQWIAWEVVHGTYKDRVNELRVASVDDPGEPRTLLSYPGRDVYMQFPKLWADELWYGIAENDWEALTEKPRVEMLDLADPASLPVAFGAEQRAFMPAPGRDVVAWKTGGTDELAALNAGFLSVYRRDTGKAVQLPIPGDERSAARIAYPSVGNRFVAWWDEIRTRLYVYDVAELQFRRIAEYDPAGDAAVLKPSLSGDLLVYMHYTGDAEHYLEWAVLPQ